LIAIDFQLNYFFWTTGNITSFTYFLIFLININKLLKYFDFSRVYQN